MVFSCNQVYWETAHASQRRHFWKMAALTLKLFHSQLAAHLTLEGIKALFDIKTVRINEKLVETQWVLF